MDLEDINLDMESEILYSLSWHPMRLDCQFAFFIKIRFGNILKNIIAKHYVSDGNSKTFLGEQSDILASRQMLDGDGKSEVKRQDRRFPNMAAMVLKAVAVR